MKKNIFITILFCFTIIKANSQTISGKVVDEDTVPIEFANVVLLQKTDSSFVAGTTTDSAGIFLFNFSVNNYILRISTIGYETMEKLINQQDLGIITLKNNTVSLDEVVVKGNRPAFYYQNNTLVMTIENTAISELGSAGDIIRRMPGVIENKGSLIVFGKGTPEIYINNKKVRNSDELSLLNSKDIKSIELVNNPGAQYDATTRAVLIVRTIKKNNNFSVLYRQRLQQGLLFRHNETLTLNYTKNKFNAYLNVFNANVNLKTKEDIKWNIFTDTIWNERSLNNYKKKNNNLDIQIGVDYDISKNHTAGVQYFFAANTGNVDIDLNYNILANNNLFSQIQMPSEMAVKNNRHNANMFYFGKLSEKLNLKVDFDFITNKYNENQSGSEISDNEQRTVTSQSETLFDIYATKINFNYIPKINHSIDFGMDYSNVQGKGNYNNIENYVKNNNYKNSEEKESFFIEYNYSNKVQLNVGLRFENVKSRYEDLMDNHNSSNKIYKSLFPDFSLTMPVKGTTMGLAFSSSISRPSFQQLNNRLFYASRFHYEKGNPQLQPQFLYDLTYVFNWKFMNVQFNYQHIKDFIGLSSYADNENSYRTISTFVNFNKYQQLMCQLNGTHNISIWNIKYSVAIIKPCFSNIYLNETILSNKSYGYFSLRNIFRLPKEITVFVDFQYITTGNQYPDYVSTMHKTDTGISKSLFNKAVTLTLWCIDIFDGNNYKTWQKINNVYFWKQSWDDNRYIQLMITYNFNINGRKKYRGENAAKDEMNRL
ncbi:MAG: outer membrane beta-barrel protein [Prevotellaceae bacterium]|nr:outer membrane beta-barrel protein [Prevotellaceae bacterium]